MPISFLEKYFYSFAGSAVSPVGKLYSCSVFTINPQPGFSKRGGLGEPKFLRALQRRYQSYSVFFSDYDWYKLNLQLPTLFP